MATFRNLFPGGIPEESFNVYCKRCGAGLCNNSKPHKSKNNHAVLLVEPCETCCSPAKLERPEYYHGDKMTKVVSRINPEDTDQEIQDKIDRVFKPKNHYNEKRNN